MIGDIATWVTAGGVLLTAFGLRQVYLGRMRQFEFMYVQRYWSILDRLSLDALKGKPSSIEHQQADEKVAWAYLQLCEDELEMRAEGWLGNSTYKIWRSSICGELHHPLFFAALRSSQDEPNPPFAYIRQLLDSDAPREYDPCNSLWRRIRCAGIGGV